MWPLANMLMGNRTNEGFYKCMASFCQVKKSGCDDEVQGCALTAPAPVAWGD